MACSKIDRNERHGSKKEERNLRIESILHNKQPFSLVSPTPFVALISISRIRACGSEEPTDESDESMLRPGTGIQLFGLPPAQSSFEKAKGVVVSFNSRLDRYIVCLDDGRGKWRLARRHVVRQNATISELISAVHGFEGVAQNEVVQLECIHGEARVFELNTALIKEPAKIESKCDGNNSQWSVAADLQLVVRATCNRLQPMHTPMHTRANTHSPTFASRSTARPVEESNAARQVNENDVRIAKEERLVNDRGVQASPS